MKKEMAIKDSLRIEKGYKEKKDQEVLINRDEGTLAMKRKGKMWEGENKIEMRKELGVVVYV